MTEDSVLLAEALPDLKARTGVETLIPDGGYGSPDNDQLLAEHPVTLIQVAIRGRPRGPERFYLEDFQVQADESGVAEPVTCPMGKKAPVIRSRSGQGWVAVFQGKAYAACAARSQSSVVGRKRSAESVLRFTAEELRRAERRRRARQYQGVGRNLRAAVESTVRSVKHPSSCLVPR